MLSPDPHGPRRGWRPLVLLVEDDAIAARILHSVVERDELLHVGAATVAEARAAAAAYPVDLAVVDVGLPDGTGLALVQELRGRPDGPGTPVMVCSGMSDRETVVAALEEGVDDFLTKPVDPGELSVRLQRLLARCRPPWEPWYAVLDRLELTGPEYLERLRETRETLLTAVATVQGQGIEDGQALVARLKGLAASVGNRAMEEVLDGPLGQDPDRRSRPESILAFLRREVARFDLLIRTWGDSPGRIELPEAVGGTV